VRVVKQRNRRGVSRGGWKGFHREEA
jgi:hypothetical protein